MIELILIIIGLTVVVLGDIIWLEATEAIWTLGQKFPRWKLNFNKRRHPQRVRRDYR